MLNPAFSIKHMREMTPIFYEVSHKVRLRSQILLLLYLLYHIPNLNTSDDAHPMQLRLAIDARVRDARPTEIDMVGWMGRTALELMGQAGLGYSFDPLAEDAADEYGAALKNLVYAHCYSNRITVARSNFLHPAPLSHRHAGCNSISLSSRRSFPRAGAAPSQSSSLFRG